jgi:hypothetical protein
MHSLTALLSVSPPDADPRVTVATGPTPKSKQEGCRRGRDGNKTTETNARLGALISVPIQTVATAPCPPSENFQACLKRSRLSTVKRGTHTGLYR